jgi:hypothetical protein
MTITNRYTVKSYIGKAAIVTATYTGIDSEYCVIRTDRKTGAQRVATVSGIYAALDRFDAMKATAR